MRYVADRYYEQKEIYRGMIQFNPVQRLQNNYVDLMRMLDEQKQLGQFLKSRLNGARAQENMNKMMFYNNYMNIIIIVLLIVLGICVYIFF